MDLISEPLRSYRSDKKYSRQFCFNVYRAKASYFRHKMDVFMLTQHEYIHFMPKITCFCSVNVKTKLASILFVGSKVPQQFTDKIYTYFRSKHDCSCLKKSTNTICFLFHDKYIYAVDRVRRTCFNATSDIYCRTLSHFTLRMCPGKTVTE